MNSVSTRRVSRSVNLALAFSLVAAGTVFMGAAAHAQTPIDAVLGPSTNPGNPSGLDITSQFSGGKSFPNTLTDGTAGPLPHVDPTYANQWRMSEDVEIKQKFEGGAVWSNTKLDLAQPFSGKFSVFLGSAPNMGDGMTFTLQNDPNGRDAIGSGGGSLGVYGGNWYTAYPDHNVGDAAAQANYIHNALSIEFDTYMNDAHNYPNESGDKDLCSWYEFCSEKLNGHIAVVESAPKAIQHNNVQYGTAAAPLSNNTWRDFSVAWTPSGNNTGTLAYQVGEFAAQQFEVTDVAGFFGLTGSDSTVYWGFTASAVSKNNGGPGSKPSQTGDAEFANPMSFAILKQPAPLESTVPVQPVVNAAECTVETQGTTVWQTVTQPANSDTVTYSHVTVDDAHVASIVATPAAGNTFTGVDLGEGWSLNDDGTATWTHQLTSKDCAAAPPVAPKNSGLATTGSDLPWSLAGGAAALLLAGLVTTLAARRKRATRL